MINETQKELVEQTNLWHKKAEDVLKTTKALDKKGEEFLTQTFLSCASSWYDGLQRWSHFATLRSNISEAGICGVAS